MAPYSTGLRFKGTDLTLKDKLFSISLSYLLVITLVACFGFVMLYSAANGNLHPWAMSQAQRFGLGVTAFFIIALIDIRFWMRYAYLFYFITLLLLIAVEVKGSIGMGAQRWIDLKFIRLQPSELMKITLVLALARYFHTSTLQEIESSTYLVLPLLMVLVPTALIIKQPDLGTALMLMMVGGTIIFLVGVEMWKFAIVAGLGLAAIPMGWIFVLRDYQKERIRTFLDPERDPLGHGYNIIQSKITLGSGGVFGKGLLKGTQSHLKFLPEHQTDFIFTMLGEEFGMVGGLSLIFLYILIIAFGYAYGLRCQSYYGKIVALGLTANFFLYVVINIAMVMGLIPVVGVPLPLISYGGTVMLTLMAGFGFIMNAGVHGELQIGRRGGTDDLL